MFEVLTAHGADALRWQSLWDRLPADLRDVHYSPAYGRVQEVLGGSARCAVLEWDDWVWLQPFMLRDIAAGYSDMTSMYGHGGPLCTMRSSSATTIAAKADAEFARWRVEHKVVSEFCALHPMLAEDQDRLIHPSAQVREVRQTVAMRVDWADEYILKDMRRDRRQNMERAGDVEIKQPLGSSSGTFACLYAETMLRHSAPKRWNFSFNYFDAHVHELFPDRMAFLFAARDGVTSVASMVLFGRRHAHYQFTGTADIMPRGANDKLVMEAARVARRAGCSWLLLGGGTTSSPDDTLLQFKSGFSKYRFMARTYSRVFDADAYARLCREAGRDPLNRSGFFPAYRAEAA